MLWLRAVPRDHFDILALWKRMHQRRTMATAMADPAQRARMEFGAVGRVPVTDPARREADDRRFHEIADLRMRISDLLSKRDREGATQLYAKLLSLDERQCLPERDQLEIARELYTTQQYPRAAAVFARFVEAYPTSSEAGNVRLLLGIIYARDLREYEAADQELSRSLTGLRDAERRAQCFRWLSDVRAALGRPAPER